MAITPLMINLHEKKVVIVGGGNVAERRIQTLLESGALITVVSPKVRKEVHNYWKKGRINWIKKYVTASDLDEAFLIIIATNNPVVNRSIILDAPSNALINAATNAELGNVEFPSFFRRGKLAISISTNGASPQLAKKIKEQLQTVYNDNYEGYVDFLYESRQLMKHSHLDRKQQNRLLKELISEIYLDNYEQEKAIKRLESLLEMGDVP